jgi:hypothetical protein
VTNGAAGPGDNTVYDYEPGEGEILETLLPRNLTIQIFRALLENAASEQGARMSAMDNATRNAGDMIKRQTLTYNRTRQAQITKELIEIISGRRGALIASLRPSYDVNRQEDTMADIMTPRRGRRGAKAASPRSSAPSSTCSSTATCRKS